MLDKDDFGKITKQNYNTQRNNYRNIDEDIYMDNFFDLNDNDLIAFNQYDLKEALKRLDSLTIDDISDDLKFFQTKDFQFRNEEDETKFSLDNVKFVTSSRKDDGDTDYYLLNDLKEYLISDEMLKKKDENENIKKPSKKIILEIITQENGKKDIYIRCLVQPKSLSKNIVDNFLKKSEFEKAKKIDEDFNKNVMNNYEEMRFKLSIKIQTNSITKIMYTKLKNKYFIELQSPPIFRTNFFVSDLENDDNPKEENCLFPFRNFEDEISNLKYRHFIIMIEKNSINNDNDNDNDNLDTKEELYNSLYNLFNKANKVKFIEKDNIELKTDEKNKNITYFFKYNKEEKISKKLKQLCFLKEKDEICYDEEAIKLFYQVLALISERILSYYNGVELLNNLLIEDKYRNSIFEKCTDEHFPILFNLTLTKILDKYQNSFQEKPLKRFENEMKRTFKALYALYETEGLKEVLKPSKNEILIRVQRCVVTPTYILFTPYVLEEGNRVLRKFIESVNYSMLCTFKMDSLEEGRWNNPFLMEYIKFILSKGFDLGEKRFRFFNYSQSQFRNFSCWLLTNPEEIIPKLGDFSKIKQLSKYAARISQTLTTTIETISIPGDKIEFIPDVKSKDDKYTFSDGVGKISVTLSEQISKKLKLDYIPSCFQGRFLGCKGVWTTMWDDHSGTIYCRDSQIKFDVEKQKNNNFFELCDYSRYIQSYLNRQIILLLNSLGIADDKFMKKLTDYKSKLNDEKFVLSLVHYPEWNQILKVMNHCGINKANDRLLKSLIESNIDILYNDIKKKARIYVEKSAYVIGIMDEYGILEYGEAFLHIKRDNLDIILDQECAVAKCPCLHPGDIRVLTFKKYNKNDESTKKYEVFNNYANVIIFPSKGKRPHPDECSGSDLDGDNYFIFYDDDLVPSKSDLFEPMSYLVEKKEPKRDKPFTINDVITYFAEYTNLNSLGLIGDAHLALSDRMGAKGEIPLKLAKKFSKAVDAPKTGDKVTLDKDETPEKFPHFMGKNKNKSYISKNILGQLYDEANQYISQRIKKKNKNGDFYDKDLILKNWERYAFPALMYYRDYFNDLVNLLKKNEITGESVLLTGNNIDNENSVLSKKKHNYDLREKIGIVIHDLFIKNKNNFYELIQNFFIKNEAKIKNEKSKKKNKTNQEQKSKFTLDKIDLINDECVFMNDLNLFASACYMISYNISDEVINKNDKNGTLIEKYCDNFSKIIFDNIIINDDIEELTEITEYDSANIGIDYYEYSENLYDSFYDKINQEQKAMKEIFGKKLNDMKNFVKEISRYTIPDKPNEENYYRILSFPWCISGHILSNIKFLNYQVN